MNIIICLLSTTAVSIPVAGREVEKETMDDQHPHRHHHGNSQHVLAIRRQRRYRRCRGDDDDSVETKILEAFGAATSELPCSVWRSSDDSSSSDDDNVWIVLASNFPDCIQESNNFVVLCAGFPYNFHSSSSSMSSSSKQTFARTILDKVEEMTRLPNNASKPSLSSLSSSSEQQQHCRTTDQMIRNALGRYLKQVSGHFAVLVVHKPTLQLFAWNDPFGFMPLFVADKDAAFASSSSTSSRRNDNDDDNDRHSIVALSTYWDCLVPSLLLPGKHNNNNNSHLTLDWDIVAEYLTFGTTLGGKRVTVQGVDGLIRTFCRHIYNLEPGTCLTVVGPSNNNNNRNMLQGTTMLSKGCSSNAKNIMLEVSRYIECYGACEQVFKELPADTLCSTSQQGNSDHVLKKTSTGTKIAPKTQLELPRNSNLFSSWTGCWRQRASNSLRPKSGGNKEEGSTTMIPPGVKIVPLKKEKKMYQPHNTLYGDLPATSSDSSSHHGSSTMVGKHKKEWVLDAIFDAIKASIRQAFQCGIVTGAALTGGGDTRLILACLLLQWQQQNPENGMEDKVVVPYAFPRDFMFQTHAKQKTDWQIARYLVQTFALPHRQIKVTTHTTATVRRTTKESILSDLHDQTPYRRKQKRSTERFRESIMTHTIHGRFGTELLGFLCFDKSPLPVRTREDLEIDVAPRATRLFHAMFGAHATLDQDEAARKNSKGNPIEVRNPVDTLREVFDCLEGDRRAFDTLHANAEIMMSHQTTMAFDVAFAFQLKLFTRAFLSDIYKGLRGGSWFAIPSSYFLRNCFSPFLDAHLLRVLLCVVAPEEKDEPYELYGKVYEDHVPDVLLKVPSNNKLLCTHTPIPRAAKVAEKQSCPFVPDVVSWDRIVSRKSTKETDGFKKLLHGSSGSTYNILERLNATQQQALLEFQNAFSPVFWKAAMTWMKVDRTRSGGAKKKPEDSKEKVHDNVQRLIEAVGKEGDAQVLCTRLNSFLLWCERRFLPHL